jgi:hypothetical protein
MKEREDRYLDLKQPDHHKKKNQGIPMVWVESRSAIVDDSREPVFWHPLPKLFPVKISGQNHISMINGSYLSVQSLLDYGTELNSFFCDNYIDTRRMYDGLRIESSLRRRM